MEKGGTREGKRNRSGDERKGIRRGGEMGKVLTYLDGMRQNLAWLPMSGNV